MSYEILLAWAGIGFVAGLVLGVWYGRLSQRTDDARATLRMTFEEETIEHGDDE